MAGKMKKILLPIDSKKVYLEYEGQCIELGNGSTEALTSVEEEALKKMLFVVNLLRFICLLKQAFFLVKPQSR